MSNKRIKYINPLDFFFLVVILASSIGFMLTRAGHAGVNKILQGQKVVNMDVYFIGLKTADTSLFKVGEKTALTIRNQPVYPPMTITKVKQWPRQIAFPAPSGKKLVTFTDPTQPLARDFLVTISDQAEVTRDGYVLHGNKIKVGNMVELEGFKYRMQGVVVDIQPE